MKNQYFADISDYRKYSFLRCFSEYKKIYFYWMLTENDGSTDGGINKYLKNPKKWKKFDEEIYKLLLKSDYKDGVENVSYFSFFENCKFNNCMISDCDDSRYLALEKILKESKNLDIIFADPDNGLCIDSVVKGKARSSKYIYWDEIKQMLDKGLDLMIYQHFRVRSTYEMRNELLRLTSLEINRIKKCKKIYISKFPRAGIIHCVMSNFNYDPIYQNIKNKWLDQFEYERII